MWSVSENTTSITISYERSLIHLLLLTGDTAAAMEALANTVVASSDPSYTGDGKGKEKKLSLVEDPAGHITLKKILSYDRDLMHQGKDGKGTI